MTTPVFQDELMLAGWSETHTGGAKVTFWLPDASALDAFRTMTVKKGNTAGQRFACVLVEIGDDEQPVEPETHIRVSDENQQVIGDYGKYYEALYKSGWFNSRDVQSKFGPDQATIKAALYELFGVTSMREVEPARFAAQMHASGLLHTLPAMFKGYLG